MDYSPINEFKAFLTKEISPATKDIEKLEDKNRKHIQKLVYTNLVDRFDTMIDATILANCREENFAEQALKGATGPVSEADIYRLLMQGDGIQQALTTRLQDGLRNTVLRQRHSRKFQLLLQVISPSQGADTQMPRVNISTGQIVDKFKPQNKKIPHSIVGYTDWLYSRRNSIVHGAGSTQFLRNDRDQIQRLWKVEVTATFKISVGSITNALKFYSGAADILQAES